MATGGLFTFHIEEIAAGGSGLARLGGQRVFIDKTAPGDLARCRIVEEHRDWARAELVELVQASPDRAEPACPLYGSCGGCSLQHLRYEAQLAAKTAILKKAFTRQGGIIPGEPRIFPSSPWEYRNRMEFHRIKRPREAPVGLKARGGEGIIALEDCPVADPGIRAALKAKTILPPPEKDRFAVYARQGLFLSEGGRARGRVTLLGREITLDAGVFFQGNGAMLETLIEDLRKIAGEADPGLPMADIYCGVGTFAFFLGEFFPRTDLVEENKKALALARENLAGEGKNFFALRDNEWVRLRGRSGRAPYGFILTDPPRQGLSPAMARWLAAEGPPLLAYVSCDPATLARDSGTLAAGGYALSELGFYDFYPQTAHIESLAVFKKNKQ